MTETEQNQPDPVPAENTEPPANPQPDQDAIEQGEQKLEEISGN